MNGLQRDLDHMTDVRTSKIGVDLADPVTQGGLQARADSDEAGKSKSKYPRPRDPEDLDTEEGQQTSKEPRHNDDIPPVDTGVFKIPDFSR